MTKKMLWYVCVGLLCCGLGAIALTAKMGSARQSGGVAAGLKVTVRGAGTTYGQSAMTSNQPENIDQLRQRAALHAQMTNVSTVVDKQDFQALEQEIAMLEAQCGSPAATEAEAAVSMDVKLRLNALYAMRPENHVRGRSLDQGNDACPATVIGALPYTDSGTTVGMVNDYNTATCASSAAPDVIYSFTPATTATRTVSLCGSSFDTALEVREGGACPGTIQDGCNDDFCGVQSQITLSMTAGVTYYIIVDGFSTASGTYTLNVSEPAACNVVCQGGDVIEATEPAVPDSTNMTTDPDGGCNNVTPLYGAINCGQTVCGRAFTYLRPSGTQVRDTDWYLFTIANPCTVTVTATAEFPLLIGIVTGVNPCTAPAFVVSGTQANVCTQTSVQAICLAAGQYAMFVSPSVFTGYSTPVDYRATLTCSAPCAPCLPDFTINAPGSTPLVNTLGAGDNCNLRSGEDYTIQVNIPTTGQYTIAFCQPDGVAWDTYAYITTACCGGTLLFSNDDGCQDNTTGFDDPTFACITLNAGTYYVDFEPFTAGTTGAMQCVVTQCAPCAPLFTQTAPFTQASPGTTTTNTCNLTAGPDETWEITIPTTGEWSFSLCPTLPGTWDSYIRLSSTCCGVSIIDQDGSNCDGANLSEIFCYPLTAGVYYLTVEEFFGSALSPYTLQVYQCVPCDITCAPGSSPENEPTCDPAVPDVTNGGCNSIPPVAGTISCGQTVCGQAAANDTIRDTDWYTVVVPPNVVVSITIQAERSMQYGLVDTSLGCASASFLASGTSVACSTNTVVASCVGSGTYFVFVSPAAFPTLCSDYNVTVTCTPGAGGPANDLCANAVNAGTTAGGSNINFTHSSDNTGACEECSDLSGGLYGDSWYTFTLSEPCSLTIDLCGTPVAFGNAYIVLTTACPCDPAWVFADSWNFTDCGDGNIKLFWPVLPAGTYWYPVLKQTGTSEGPYTIHFQTYCTQCDPIFDLTALPYHHRFNANPGNAPDSVSLVWSVPDTAMVDSVIIYSADGAYPTLPPPGNGWTTVTTAYGTPVAAGAHPNYAYMREWVDTRPLSVLPGTPGVPKTRFYNVTRFYCYIAPPPPPPQAAEQCPGTPLTGTLPIVTSNTTAGLTSNYSCVGLGATAPASCWSPGGGTYYSETSTCAGPDAAYDWTVPTTGTYTFSLAGSTFDTGLLLYTYTCPTEPVNPTNYICGSDDSAADLTSFIGSVSLTAGQRILIIVDGFGTANGAYTLTISTP